MRRDTVMRDAIMRDAMLHGQGINHPGASRHPSLKRRGVISNSPPARGGEERSEGWWEMGSSEA
jgi:hypothetical protein